MTFSTHFITHKFPQIAKIAIVFKQQPFRNVTYEKFGRVETRPIHYIDAVVVEDDRNEKKTRISKEKKLLRHHLDHYLPKSLNPFFSLSFYNLIPSCYECNSPLKGDENKIQPYNPYTDDFDNDAVFSVEYAEEYKNSDINNINNIKILINPRYLHKNIEKIQDHCKLLKLNERYAYRRDYVCELLDKKDVWTADMIDEFKNRLLYRYDDAEALNILNRVIWGNYLDKKSINKRPLTKLTRDILNCNE